MQLNLVNFNCRVSESWDNDNTSFAFDSCEEKTGTILIQRNPCTWALGLNQSAHVSADVPAEPVNIQLSDDAVPVQKPAKHVPMSLKDKF